MGEPTAIGSVVNNFVPQSSRPGPARPRPGGSAKVLAESWPATYEACISTYFKRVNFVLVDSAGHCDAGYMLNAVLAMKARYFELHGHKPVSDLVLDRAAAREINYHFVRGHRFDVPKAALYKCLLNLVAERPEKFR